MAKGAGKYDDETTAAMRATAADVVILIVLGGNRGSGFSVQATTETAPPPLALALILRGVASAIEAET